VKTRLAVAAALLFTLFVGWLSGFGAGTDEAQRLAAGLTQSAGGAVRVHGPALPVKFSEKP